MNKQKLSTTENMRALKILIVLLLIVKCVYLLSFVFFSIYSYFNPNNTEVIELQKILYRKTVFGLPLYVDAVFFTVAMAVAAVGILQRKNWAMKLFLILTAINLFTTIIVTERGYLFEKILYVALAFLVIKHKKQFTS